MKPLSLIGLILGIALLTLGVLASGENTEKVLSRTVILVALIMIGFAGTFLLVALFKKDKK